MLMRPKFLILIVLFSDILTSYHTFPLQLQRTHSINLQKLHSSALSSSELSPVADELIGWNSNESSYAIFLDKYWQKKPVFIRSALTQEDCTRLSKNDLIELVGNDDVESRLFKHLKGKKWDKSYGPFDPNTIDSLPSEKWSILIQVNQVIIIYSVTL